MDSLITYFIVLSSLAIVSCAVYYLVIKLAEAETRQELASAMETGSVSEVKAILAVHGNRLSSEVKVNAQNWLDERSK